MIDSRQGIPQANPFNLYDTAPAMRRSTSQDDFSRQLSDALTESLRRLGVDPGKISVSIGGTGNSAASGQIVVTLNSDTALEAPNGGPSAAVAPAPASDEAPTGGGKTTPSGAPRIELSSAPCRNQYGYTGPAAYNPYFTSPANPFREGYVEGFRNWFNDAEILGGPTGPVSANRLYYATEEGANEALRLVQEHEPAAELVETNWGGGPYAASRPMYEVRLPGDRRLNAGLLLSAYYNGGSGVSASSDLYLARELSMA